MYKVENNKLYMHESFYDKINGIPFISTLCKFRDKQLKLEEKTLPFVLFHLSRFWFNV